MIVIDKSYLEGAPTRVVRALCAQRRVIFPETLLFELLITDNDSTASFRKLPNRDNPVRLPCKGVTGDPGLGMLSDDAALLQGGVLPTGETQLATVHGFVVFADARRGADVNAKRPQHNRN